MDRERWEPLLAGVVHASADAAQRVDEIRDRTLVHARHARQRVLAAAERQGSGERPKGGAGVTEKELGFAYRERSARPDDPVSMENDPEPRESLTHDLGVVGVEQAADLGFALRERGKQQDAVGDALRARQAYRAGGAARRLQLEDFSH